MALINCSECGKEESDKASACPNCGAPISVHTPLKEHLESPIQVKRPGSKLEALGTLLIIVGIFAGFAVNFQLGGLLILAGFVIFLIGRFN